MNERGMRAMMPMRGDAPDCGPEDCAPMARSTLNQELNQTEATLAHAQETIDTILSIVRGPAPACDEKCVGGDSMMDRAIGNRRRAMVLSKSLGELSEVLSGAIPISKARC